MKYTKSPHCIISLTSFASLKKSVRSYLGFHSIDEIDQFLAVFWSYEETLTALFRTSFQVEFPFDMVEIFVFIIIGVIAGLASANFIIFHKYLSKQMPKIFKTKFQVLFNTFEKN